MAALRTRRRILKTCQMMLLTTTYQEASDSITAQVRNADNLLERDRYTMAHLGLEGSFSMSFPGSAEPEEIGLVGEVWPIRSQYQLSQGTFTVTALSSGSKYLCVVPLYPSDRVVHSQFTLDQNQPERTVSTGSVAAIFGSDYTINGVACSGVEVIACETQSALIQRTSSDCQLIEFEIRNGIPGQSQTSQPV